MESQWDSNPWGPRWKLNPSITPPPHGDANSFLNGTRTHIGVVPGGQSNPPSLVGDEWCPSTASGPGEQYCIWFLPPWSPWSYVPFGLHLPQGDTGVYSQDLGSFVGDWVIFVWSQTSLQVSCRTKTLEWIGYKLYQFMAIEIFLRMHPLCPISKDNIMTLQKQHYKSKTAVNSKLIFLAMLLMDCKTLSKSVAFLE